MKFSLTNWKYQLSITSYITFIFCLLTFHFHSVTVREIVPIESVFCLCKNIIHLLDESRNEIVSEVMSICLLSCWSKKERTHLHSVFGF